MSFFPRWYFITYTKLWEWKQLIGRSFEQQVQVLHGEEMDDLLRIVGETRTFSAPVKIVVPPHGTYPLLGVVALWRSGAGSDEQLISVEHLPTWDGGVVYPVPRYGREWQPTRDACDHGGCACPAHFFGAVKYVEVQ